MAFRLSDVEARLHKYESAVNSQAETPLQAVEAKITPQTSPEVPTTKPEPVVSKVVSVAPAVAATTSTTEVLPSATISPVSPEISSLVTPIAPTMTRNIPYPAPIPTTPSQTTPSQSFEQLIGKRWMTWTGVAILFFSTAFFLKYAFQNNLIGPTGQVILCALAGVAVLVAGTRFIRKEMRALGQGLMGLGMAILYVTFAAAASSIYTPPVLTQAPAFLLLAAVTVAGMSLAVLHNASPIALLAVLGGLAAPLLVSTGHNSRDALFTYLLLLDLGVLGVAFFRQWRTLDAVAMVGTYALFAGWFVKFYDKLQLAPTLGWLTFFYIVFLCLPFVFHLLRKTDVALERFLLALANAVFAFGFFWTTLHEEHQQSLGFIALGLALIYFLMGTAFRRRLPSDGKTLFGSIALAVTFLTMAFPLHLHAHGITLAWAVEGPVLLYLGFRFRYFPIRLFSAIVLALAVFRLFTEHWPLHTGLYEPFFNRRFLSAALIPLAMAVSGWIHQRISPEGYWPDRTMKLIATLGGGILGLILVQVEGCDWLDMEMGRYTAFSVASAIWTAGALIYLYVGRYTKSSTTWMVGSLALFIASIQGIVALGQSWPTAGLPFLNIRFIALLFFIIALFLYAHVIGISSIAVESASTIKPLFWGMGILALLVLISFEIPTFLTNGLNSSEETAQMAMTLTWGFYAAALLAVGFRRQARVIRYCALGLFGISALKLLLVDMRQTEDLLRIVSFMAVGGLMLAASYFYHRLEKKLSSDSVATQDKSAQESEDFNAKQN